MENLKNHFYTMLAGGINIPEEHLLLMFAELADLSDLNGENDFIYVGVNSTTMFAQKGLEYFLEEDYDGFIEYYRQLLLKQENYEILNYLGL